MPLPILPIAATIAAEFAPDLLRWLAGDKAGDVAQRIVDSATGATGTQSGEAALGILRTDPALAAKFRTDMAQIDAELEKAYLADRADARAMSVDRARVSEAVARQDALRKNLMITTDWIGLIACLVAIFFLPADAPGELRGLLATIASIFGLCLRDAHQFEFGSSRGSEQKTALLQQLPR